MLWVFGFRRLKPADVHVMNAKSPVGLTLVCFLIGSELGCGEHVLIVRLPKGPCTVHRVTSFKVCNHDVTLTFYHPVCTDKEVARSRSKWISVLPKMVP